jgi:hypothetical protein
MALEQRDELGRQARLREGGDRLFVEAAHQLSEVAIMPDVDGMWA